MKKALLIPALLVSAMALAGCQSINRFDASLGAEYGKIIASKDSFLARENARLVTARPSIALWAGRCTVALSYVHALAAALRLAPNALALADAAAAECRSVAETPPASVQELVAKVAVNLATIQNAAQVPVKP